MQKVAKLNLDDLSPASASFELSSYPNVKFMLGAFTLRVQIWLTKRFGKESLQHAIDGSDLEVISEVAYFVLDAAGKTRFKSLELFQEAVVSFKDRIALKNALLETMGLSAPVLEGITKQLEAQAVPEGNAPAPAQTGESSTTDLATPTPGAAPSDS